MGADFDAKRSNSNKGSLEVTWGSGGRGIGVEIVVDDSLLFARSEGGGGERERGDERLGDLLL